MRGIKDHLQVIETMVTEGAGQGVLQLHCEDERLDGRHVTVDGRRLVSFGSCSYLGLEMDERLKAGSIEAIQRYGTMFSSSRTYMSSPASRVAERLLGEVLDGHVALATTTSLVHVSTIPVVVDEGDAVILDQQVHHSVQSAANQLLAYGVPLEIVRHNRLDDVDRWVDRLRQRHRRVWYFLDGVYSMYGDVAPVEQLLELLDRHEQLHLYVDDAHGMSWAGKHGRGAFLARTALHPRMVLATSLAKAFGAPGGGVVLLPDGDLHRRVRTCGGPMIFSGPVTPPALGAIVASARIHLSPEITTMQEELRGRMTSCNAHLLERGVPLLHAAPSPIRFVPMGLPRVVYNMCRRLQADGFWVSPAVFPAVAVKRGGLRLTLTRHQRPEDLGALAAAIARHYLNVLEEEGATVAQLERTFEVALDVDRLERERDRARSSASAAPAPAAALTLTAATSITAIDRETWDARLGDRGSFGWDGLALLEQVFRDRPEEEHRWRFHYYVVRDAAGRVVLATFFTDALWKDDMIAPAEVSRRLERRRATDPYYLTSRVLAMGSWLTEGDHLYLDRTADWRGALRLMLERAAADQELAGANAVALRDLASDDAELEEVLLKEGFVKFAMPESHLLEIDWRSEEEYLTRLSEGSRYKYRRLVLPFEAGYEVELAGHGKRQLPPDELDHLHALYRRVKERSFELNTFELPRDLLDELQRQPGWELILLRPREGGAGGRPVAWGAHHVGAAHLVPLVCGLDYDFVFERAAYRVLLTVTRRRAEQLGSRRVYLGMGASVEKMKLGATPQPRSLYLQVKDGYQSEVLHQLMAGAVRGERAVAAGRAP